MAVAGPVLALDFGKLRIGCAISDALGITATPLGFVPRASDAAAARIIAALARERGAVALAIGLPLHAHGDAGKAVERVRSFTQILASVCPLPVHEVDERWSTCEAEAAFRTEGRWPVPPGELDARSATIILRRFLAGER